MRKKRPMFSKIENVNCDETTENEKELFMVALDTAISKLMASDMEVTLQNAAKHLLGTNFLHKISRALRYSKKKIEVLFLSEFLVLQS